MCVCVCVCVCVYVCVCVCVCVCVQCAVRLFLTKHYSFNLKKISTFQSSHHRNVSTDPLGTGRQTLWNHWTRALLVIIVLLADGAEKHSIPLSCFGCITFGFFSRDGAF